MVMVASQGQSQALSDNQPLGLRSRQEKAVEVARVAKVARASTPSRLRVARWC